MKYLVLTFITLTLVVGCTQPGADVPKEFTRRWTASGDDGNVGACSGYVMKYSLSRSDLAGNFEACVTCAIIPTGAGHLAGTPESTKFTITIPLDDSVYFAIKAFDDASPTPNKSGLSNIWAEYTGPDNVPPAAITDLR
jgi:hypothetical protein